MFEAVFPFAKTLANGFDLLTRWQMYMFGLLTR